METHSGMILTTSFELVPIVTVFISPMERSYESAAKQGRPSKNDRTLYRWTHVYMIRRMLPRAVDYRKCSPHQACNYKAHYNQIHIFQTVDSILRTVAPRSSTVSTVKLLSPPRLWVKCSGLYQAKLECKGTSAVENDNSHILDAKSSFHRFLTEHSTYHSVAAAALHDSSPTAVNLTFTGIDGSVIVWGAVVHHASILPRHHPGSAF